MQPSTKSAIYIESELPNHRYIVIGSSGRKYTVDLNKNTCTCAYAVNRSTAKVNVSCSHIKYVRLTCHQQASKN